MKHYILILLATVLLVSCDDFLGKPQENFVPSDDGVDYSLTANMGQPLVGLYSTSNFRFSFWAQYGLLSVRGDDVDKGGGSDADQGELFYAENFVYSLITDYWALNNTWTGLYGIVLNANATLNSLNKYGQHIKNDADRQLNLQYQAQARFLRAYAMFYISRMWGDAPLYLNQESILDDLLRIEPSVPREDIYKFINSEMDFCIANLPALRPNEMPLKGQVTKYTALALKAKANAEINNWDAVLSATNEIIISDKFTLFPDFYTYFKRPGRLCDENLFELQFSDLGQGAGAAFTSDAWFVFQGPRRGFVGDAIGAGWGFLTPSDKIIKLFKQRGETDRAKTTFLYAGTITMEGDTLNPPSWLDEKKGIYSRRDSVFNGKAYFPSTDMTPGRTDYGLGNNVRMMRYADVLLLNAEAKVRKGQNGDAPFNLVRERAKMPELTNVTLDQILEERLVEFACEWGERYFDLVRTGKAATTLRGFVVGRSEFYPIPQSQRDLNPNL